MATFEVTRNGTTVADTVFDVDPLTDTANPFGDFCVVKMDDRGGQKFQEYPRGTRLDVSITDDAGNTFERFTGYVVERRETEQSGADVLEVEAYSFDQFLRRNTITNDQTGNTITEALKDIIQTDTSVTYVAGNVDVGDNQELTRGYQGVAVEKALRDIAFKSNNENFGVNDSLEFFFRPRETVHIDRGVDNTQWFNYDIPELGKEAINEVEVWYAGGDKSVIVDDGTDKLDLQDNLSLAEPGTQRAELQRPLITDIGDAEDIGRKYLAFRSATLSGTVTTFGLFDAEPGDTIDIQIDARGIDGEFLIASTEYRWGVDQTILTIVEKRGDVDDILTELNDAVQRVEMSGANRDAPGNRITTTNAAAVVGISVDADGNTPDGDRFVNPGRRLVRDAWTGKPYAAISSLVVGSDGAGLSRSNTALRNQTNSAAVTQTLPDATSVEFSASITQTGVEEVGLEASDGTLIARATFDAPVDLAGTVTVTLDVSNDASVSRGVLTTNGQTSVRDVLASNSPTLPADYAYGSDNTTVDETDTALGNELVSVSLDEVLIQDADTESEWRDILPTITDDDAFVIDATGPQPEQICWTEEGESEDRSSGSGVAFESNADLSGGNGRTLTATGDIVEYDFTPQHDIPAGDVECAIRDWSGVSGSEDLPELEWRLNGDVIDTTSGGFTPTLGWSEVGDGSYSAGAGYTGDDLEAGTTYTLVVEATSVATAESYLIDVVAPYDGRYSADLFFDDDNGGNDGYLDGPELYPDTTVRSLTTAETRRNVTTANFESTWNDTSGSQYVELANDGSTFNRVNNASSGSVTFASPDRGVDTNIAWSRYGSRTSATPQTGFNIQQIDSWELYADPSAVVSDDIDKTLTRAVVAPDTITGTTVREAGIKNGSTLLTRHILADFDVLSGQRVSSSETSSFVSDN